MVKNILGNGIDIPLLGLREACLEVTGDLHELFTDESYKISQCFLLSTSQVSRPHQLTIFSQAPPAPQHTSFIYLVHHFVYYLIV